MHYHYRRVNPHLEFMTRAKFNIAKMFTPPKSKSPWEAMTAGSTGGWAKGLEGAGWVGPALAGIAAPFTGGLSLLGAAGMGAAGMMGKGTGFQGTDKGWSNVGSTLLGGLAGAGMGGLGAGIGGAVSGAFGSGAGSLLGKLGTGFATGVKNYMSPLTNLFSKGAVGAASKMDPSLANPYGKNWGVPSLTGTMTQSPYGISGSASSMLPSAGIGEAVSGIFGGGAGGGGGQGLLQSVLNTFGGQGGANTAGLGSLLGMFTPQGSAPQLQGNRDQALGYINTPDLTQARGMIRDLAMKSPSELMSPAGDAYVEATLRQHRAGVEKQMKLAMDAYGARGQVAGKSGAVDKYIREASKNALQQENDYIAQINETRMMAATKMKIEAVQNYYNISAQEAAAMLQAEGYVNPIDYQNYQVAMQEYQAQQALNQYQQMGGGY